MLLVSGDIARRTGGNLYDRRMERACRRASVPLRIISARSTAHARAALDRAKPSVVVVDSIALSLAAPLVPWIRHRLGARIVALMHMATPPATAVVLRAADAVVAVSSDLARTLARAGVPRSRLAVIPPGSDGIPRIARGKRRARDRQQLRVLAVANWSASKGIAMLVAATAQVPSVHLDLVGDTGRAPYRDKVLALITSKGLERRVAVHGPLDERALARRYADADVFALPTEREGYGIVFAEALLHGLPIIAADVASVREIVGDAGVFVPSRRVRPLVAALRLMSDLWLRRRLVKAARLRARALPRWTTSERTFVALVRNEIGTAVSRT